MYDANTEPHVDLGSSVSALGYPTRRILRVVLVGHDNDGSRELYAAISARFTTTEFLVILTEGVYYQRSLAASVWRLIREASFLFVARRALDLLAYRLSGDTIRSRCRRRGIRVISSRDVNDERTRREIGALRPDLIVLLYTMHLVSLNTAKLAPFGAIASHPSMLPHYRGLEVFFWALANGETETGVSVYFLDGKVDSGRIIAQEPVSIEPDDSVRTLYRKVTDVAQRLLCYAIARIDEGTVTTRVVTGKGSYYPMPTRQAYRRFQRSRRRWS